MRDGTLLYTVYWDPRIRASDQLPAVLIRSPYGFLGTENMAALYAAYGFVAVGQNQRGTGFSGGDYCFWQTSTNDGADTMAWITSQEWSNGQVFQMGASADGILTLLDIKKPQPILAGQFLMVTTATPYGTLFQNNQALRYALAHDWLELMQFWRPKIPANTYLDVAEHNEGFASHWVPPNNFTCGNVSAFSWPLITLTDQDWSSNMNFNAVWWAGWYDIFLQPQLDAFRRADALSGHTQQMIIDPFGHCGLYQKYSFPDDRKGPLWAFERSVDLFKAAVHPAQRAAMPPSPREMGLAASPTKKWTMYIMGPDPKITGSARVSGMYWTSLDEWPATTALRLYPSHKVSRGCVPRNQYKHTTTQTHHRAS